MVPPRKTTTYGKSSRRPLPAISAFTEATGNATNYSTQIPGIWREQGPKRIAGKFSRLSESPEKPSLPNKFVSTKTSRVEQRAKEVRKSVETNMDSPTEDGYTQESSTEDTGVRKKRKLTPRNDLLSPTKDSDRVKASKKEAVAEPSVDLKMNACIGGEAVEEPITTAASIRPGPKASKRESIISVDLRTRKPSTSCKSATVALQQTNKPQVMIAGEKVVPPFQDKRRALPTFPTPEVLNEEQHHANLSKLSMTNPKHKYLEIPPSPASSRAESHQPYSDDKSSPQTPQHSPKPSKIARGATTPKQQELWNKLLANGFGSNSQEPSDIHFHKRNREDQVESEKMDSSKAQHNKLNDTPRKRSGKLVDFLTSSTRDRSVSNSDCSEDQRISGGERSKSVQSAASVDEEISTLQTSPSIENLGKRRYHSQDPASVIVHQRVPSMKGAPKVTYIRERTHIGESDLNSPLLLEVPPVASTQTLRDRQSRGTGKSQPDMGSLDNGVESLGETEDSQGGPMRSIHELREAGGNSRMAGELDAILDDLEERVGSSNAGRRSSLLSLASRLLEATNCRMFIEQGLEARFFAQFDFSHNIVESSLLAASLLQILSNTTYIASNSQIKHVETTNLLVGLLDKTGDLSSQVKLRENNMSKLAQAEYASFCIAFLRSPVWRILKPPVLSGQVLALQCLDLLVRQARDAAYPSAILSSGNLVYIAETSIPQPGIRHAQPPCSKMCLELAVSILEASTKGEIIPQVDADWTPEALERISGVFPLLVEELSPRISSLQSLTLRLYLNLTNSSPRLCEEFSTSLILIAVCRFMFRQFDLLVSSENQRQTPHDLEMLVLSLGFMINLAEFSNAMRILMMELETGEQKLLDSLLQLFLNRKRAAEAYSEVEAENNVAFGYLSILLSYVCLNSIVRVYVNGREEGPKVNTLLDALQEFLQFHKQIDDSPQGGNGGTEDRKANFVGRLQVLVDELTIYA